MNNWNWTSTMATTMPDEDDNDDDVEQWRLCRRTTMMITTPDDIQMFIIEKVNVQIFASDNQVLSTSPSGNRLFRCRLSVQQRIKSLCFSPRKWESSILGINEEDVRILLAEVTNILWIPPRKWVFRYSGRIFRPSPTQPKDRCRGSRCLFTGCFFTRKVHVLIHDCA